MDRQTDGQTERCMHMLPSSILQESRGTPIPQLQQAHRTPTSWFLDAILAKGAGALGATAASRAGAEKVQREPGTSFHAESKEAFKRWPVPRKWTHKLDEAVPAGQRRT